MQASKNHSFLRRSPLAYVVVPLAFVLVSTALVFIVGRTVLAPYQALLGWFFSTTEVAQPRDLLDNAAKFSPPLSSTAARWMSRTPSRTGCR